jgi:hypothetical protein
MADTRMINGKAVPTLYHYTLKVALCYDKEYDKFEIESLHRQLLHEKVFVFNHLSGKIDPFFNESIWDKCIPFPLTSFTNDKENNAHYAVKTNIAIKHMNEAMQELRRYLGVQYSLKYNFPVFVTAKWCS